MALWATLAARGWQPSESAASGSADRPTALPALFLVEDDAGAVSTGRTGVGVSAYSTLRGFVCLGSVRSLPLLIPLAARGALVLNQAIPFSGLVRLVEQALLVCLGEATASRSAESTATLLRTRFSEATALGTLTRSETQTLRALVNGLTAIQIADGTQHSVHTIRSQIKAVLSKLGVTSQVAAVALAHRAGWPDWLPVSADFTNFGDGWR
ncbi:regulatory LuxR family protein [Jatrophihabitans sp. GAS493]|nr:regulatory LuxR family protein [Jatrophihabitans sp. GAS493]